MKLADLYGDLFEAVTTDTIKDPISKGLVPNFIHSMPSTHLLTGMDQYYQYYRFLIAVAGYPEDSHVPLTSVVRDWPMTVAYTKQEKEMIDKVAKRMGISPTEIAYEGSKELPDTFTVSPVMKFSMSETQQRKLKNLAVLTEAMINEIE